MVTGVSFPPPLVCFPTPWNVETSGHFNVEGYVGSSHITGSVLWMSSVEMDSPDEWDVNVPPINLCMRVKQVDLPLPVSPTAQGAGHEPVINMQKVKI